jgi:NAD(P)-dependent dehydrogenase (short-subunit alcohol dehydrogenase family)
VKRLFEETEKPLGSPSVLINNAGVFQVGPEHAQQMVSETPLAGRLGQPNEIAPVVVFLASDDAAWLTGERISASGGLH